MELMFSIQKQPQLRRTDWNKNNLFRSPSSSIVTQYRNPLLYNQPWQQSPQTNPYYRNGKINLNQQYYQTKRQPPTQISYSERNFIAANKQRQILGQTNFKSKGRSLGDSSVETQAESSDDNWEHHHAHRDRRDLYQRIESTSPL